MVGGVCVLPDLAVISQMSRLTISADYPRAEPTQAYDFVDILWLCIMLSQTYSCFSAAYASCCCERDLRTIFARRHTQQGNAVKSFQLLVVTRTKSS
jgi:hypothetical protein